jgi:caspase-like apoptosis-related cysteine protease
MAVMSHGKNGIIYSRNEGYMIESLLTPFSPHQCPTLAGKPKLFFIQVR